MVRLFSWSLKIEDVVNNMDAMKHVKEVFDEFPDPYVFLWNAVIRGYSMQNMFNEAIKMYLRMHEFGVRPDGFTIPHVLKACGGLQSAGIGRADKFILDTSHITPFILLDLDSTKSAFWLKDLSFINQSSAEGSGIFFTARWFVSEKVHKHPGDNERIHFVFH
ncbi:hypothetical protein ACET3Z_022928 [Daucus carota]